MDLTVGKSIFIETAQERGDLFIEQPYSLYSLDNQAAWQQLYALLRPKWERFATPTFLRGIESLCLHPDRIPTLEEINRFLRPLTGFKAIAVSGYVPSHLFFDCLSRREFPTTIAIRASDCLNYLPEPDIFHDIAGHVPMHTSATFAHVLVRFGRLAKLAAERHSQEPCEKKKMAKIGSNLQALSRFFWFTVEFGLMRAEEGLAVYGSGLLSSANEIEHAILSPEVQRHPFQLEWVVNQSFDIDRFQMLLFFVDSFDHLYREVERLEEWLLAGKLDHVSPGEPRIADEELLAFFEEGSSS